MYLFSSSIANDKTENSTNNNQGSTASSVIATNNTATTTTTAAASIPPLNAAVVKKNDKPTPSLPDKPVECTICSRKFKNIPALNGHMRLHGGYYKKDADGRRLVGKSIICLKNLGQAHFLLVLAVVLLAIYLMVEWGLN